MSALDEVINAPAPPTITVEIGETAAVFQLTTDETGIPALVAQFKEADVPHANPPEAATVLETQTAPEVAGELEPLTDEQVAEIAKAEKLEEFNEARVARGEKPLKRMPPEKKTRRTAPVVQVELDAALAKIAKLEAAIPAPAVTEMSEMEGAKYGLTAPAQTVTGVQNELDIALEIITQQKDAIAAQTAEIDRLKAEEPANPERSTPIEILVDECESRGWKVTLSR